MRKNLGNWNPTGLTIFRKFSKNWNPHNKQKRKIYMGKKIFQNLEYEIDMCPTERVFNLKLLKLNFLIYLHLKTINDAKISDISHLQIYKYLMEIYQEIITIYTEAPKI